MTKVPRGKSVASAFCSRFKWCRRVAHFMQKAQGSLEYMIILGAVLGLVATVVLFMPGIFGGISYDISGCKAAAAQCSIRLATTVDPPCSECETRCVNPISSQDVMAIDMMDGVGECGAACSLCKIGAATNISLPDSLRGSTPPVPPEPPEPPLPESDPASVLVFHFDEGTGNFVYDSTMNGNVGIVVGGSWVSGHSGYALGYDGHNDHTYITYMPGLNFEGNFTIEAWVKMGGYPDDWAPIVYKGVTPHMKNWNFCFFVNSGGDLRFSIGDRNTYNLVQNTEPLAIGQWYHLAAVLDGSSLIVYINGTAKGSTPRTINPGYSHLEVLRIAKAQSSTLNAAIDEFSIYSRAKTPAEILADSQS